MKVMGDAGARLDFSAYESGVSELGWILESSLMACELWENVKRQSNLTLICPATPQALTFTPDVARLTLNDGQMLTARLVVGADGRDSWVREAAGLKAVNTPYGEMGVVANFECEKPHRGIARQWFRDDGVLAWLPLAGDQQGDARTHRISIVWPTPDAHASELLALKPEAFAERVAAAGHFELGRLVQITAPAPFPLRLLRVPHTVAARLGLVGGAAPALDLAYARRQHILQLGQQLTQRARRQGLAATAQRGLQALMRAAPGLLPGLWLLARAVLGLVLGRSCLALGGPQAIDAARNPGGGGVVHGAMREGGLRASSRSASRWARRCWRMACSAAPAT